jgi:hypothetical protein
METIIICLLVLAIAMLLYVIAQGKKEKNNVLHNEDPLAGLPNIIGRPKDASNYSSPSFTAQSKRESILSTTDNFDKRNEGTPKVYKIPQEGPEVAEKTLPDWKEEEEEMGRYAAYGTQDGFATGVTFDELATVGKLLECQELKLSEEKIAADIVSKIDGTELLGLLESKVLQTSRKIATLLDSHLTNDR